jgi:hypothetical protein
MLRRHVAGRDPIPYGAPSYHRYARVSDRLLFRPHNFRRVPSSGRSIYSVQNMRGMPPIVVRQDHHVARNSGTLSGPRRLKSAAAQLASFCR